MGRLCPSAVRSPLLHWLESPGGLKGTLPPKNPEQGRGGDSPSPAPGAHSSSLPAFPTSVACCALSASQGAVHLPQYDLGPLPQAEGLLERWEPGSSHFTHEDTGGVPQLGQQETRAQLSDSASSALSTTVTPLPRTGPLFSVSLHLCPEQTREGAPSQRWDHFLCPSCLPPQVPLTPDV